MATTRIIPMHANRGKSVARCLTERTDYAKNPAKTGGGKFISAFECAPETADAQFLLAKREYFSLTGRRQQSDVIAYQLRQSFLPGEITPQEANQIGYELALRFTKGRHAFLVCTHTDRHHIPSQEKRHQARQQRPVWRSFCQGECFDAEAPKRQAKGAFIRAGQAG